MYSMAVNTFSNWLTAVLIQKGISQSELARQAGVTRGAINGILTGARGEHHAGKVFFGRRLVTNNNPYMQDGAHC